MRKREKYLTLFFRELDLNGYDFLVAISCRLRNCSIPYCTITHHHHPVVYFLLFIPSGGETHVYYLRWAAVGLSEDFMCFLHPENPWVYGYELFHSKVPKGKAKFGKSRMEAIQLQRQV